MPLFYQQDISATTRLAIWKIEEPEAFFLGYVPLQNAITHPHKRLQHLAGRYLLQYLFPDFPIHAIQIADTRKPFLQDEQYHFSISHCGDYAAAIVSSSERIGIDIEIKRPTVAKVAHKFLHEEEINGLQAYTSEPQVLEALTVLWCGKEAIYKWWGNGEVDFRKMIRIDDFTFGNNGVLAGRFIKNGNVFPLSLSYEAFGQLCMVWLQSK
ncbi:4'-phosphopantetheinyl transferase family protein [Parasediminibacterium sp. JCM 36343]|uniref:4'-phosphopantetheinyl transferase family protein n=1 Tax=Parasediminibacterium sp. JCM 36343 TaxID=3374279 RepID=UPI0039785D67